MMAGMWSSRIPLAVASIREFLGTFGAPPFPVQLGGVLQEAPAWSIDAADPLQPGPYRLRYTVAAPFTTIVALDPHVCMCRTRKSAGPRIPPSRLTRAPCARAVCWLGNVRRTLLATTSR